MQVEGDRVGQLEPGQAGPQPLAAQRHPAVRGIDVQPCPGFAADGGDLAQRVDRAGVRGPRGRDDDRVLQGRKRFLERGRDDPVVLARHDYRRGQAEQPGRAADAVVCVGAADRPDAAVAFPRQQQAEEVRFGAAGGHHGVGGGRVRVAEPGDPGGELALQLARDRCLVPGVHGRVERARHDVGRDGHGERRAVQVSGAGRVGRIRRPRGEQPAQVFQRAFGSGAFAGKGFSLGE